MADVADIEIAVESVGASDAQSELEGVEGSLEDTAEGLGDSAGRLERLQQRWTGAMTAITTGLFVATAALLSQVPVISELMGGLGSVIEALAFRLDGILRPALTPITNLMFEISEAIITAEGPLGTFLDIAITLGVAVGTLAGAVLAAVKAAGLLSAAWATLSAVGSVVVGALTAIAGAISLPALAIAALIAGIILVVEHFIGWGNILDFVVDKLTGLLGWVDTTARRIADFATNAASNLASWASDAAGAVDRFVRGVANSIISLVDSAAGWGRQLLQRFMDGVRSVAQGVGSFFGDLASGDFQAVGQAVVDVVGGGGAGGGGGGNPRRDRTGVFGGTREQLAVFIGGRQADQGVARYRDDNTLRRGRPQ